MGRIPQRPQKWKSCERGSRGFFISYRFLYKLSLSFLAYNSGKRVNFLQSDNYLRKRMELDVLTAISPIDGRYRGKTKALAAYFSEFALIKYRVPVEGGILYHLVARLPLPQLERRSIAACLKLYGISTVIFPEADAQPLKEYRE